jgi:hypothetical protein
MYSHTESVAHGEPAILKNAIRSFFLHSLETEFLGETRFLTALI